MLRVLLVAAWLTGSAQAGNCVGEGDGTNYYPTVNNSFPDANYFVGGRFKINNQIFPGTSSFGCVSPAVTAMNIIDIIDSPAPTPAPTPNTTNVTKQKELKYTRIMFKDMNVLSAQYWCNANGTVMSWREFNTTGCADHSLLDQGNFTVPKTINGYTFDCACLSSNVFAKRRVYNETMSDVPAQTPKRYPGAGKCGGAHVETIAMSGTCMGYFDNATVDPFSSEIYAISNQRRSNLTNAQLTADQLAWLKKNFTNTSTRDMQLRSSTMRCIDDGTSVEYLEFAGTLNCQGSGLVSNATYPVDTCLKIRNETTQFYCDRVGGGGLGKTPKVPKTFTVSEDDMIFLGICAAYLVFVTVVVSVLACCLSGFFDKKADDAAGPTPEAAIESIPVGDPVKETDGKQVSFGEAQPALVAQGATEGSTAYGEEVAATEEAEAAPEGPAQEVAATEEAEAAPEGPAQEAAATEEAEMPPEAASGELPGQEVAAT